MPTLQAADHLETCLAALGPGQTATAAAIRAAGPRSGLELAPADDGALTGRLDGRALASARRPLEEARRLADRVDLAEHAVVVVHGFGLGHHVAELARRLGRRGVVLVLEPDVSLLHSALGAVDHAAALAGSNVIIVTDPADRAALARHLQGAEWLLGQGLAFLDHPPSRRRLDAAIAAFGATLAATATHARMTVVTTLLRSVETVRNLTGNLARYVTAPGIADLAGTQTGRPAILVAAGPSLGPALDRLADPAVRERAVIVSAQTTLRPLLARGIRPHFVTALDYHAISSRFYDGLRPADVAGIELVVDPKAHPSILESFPGTVRCCRAPLLDAILGDAARPMGELPPGATVAHLSAYLARHLGCDPIVTVGQDLGFTDGLYYGPGAVIHETWEPELGTFTPITSMEWQRIARHRRHLARVESWDGGTVLSDAQMVTYLHQFERDFAADRARGLRVIDATGPGGARKRGAERMDLGTALEAFAREPIDPPPAAPVAVPDAEARRRAARAAVERARAQVAEIGGAAERATDIVIAMLAEQDDAAAMRRRFAELERERRIVGARMEAFGLVEHLNQLGTFKRLRADRRLALATDLDPRARQRAELERDRANVEWIRDAAAELTSQLGAAAARLAGDAASGGERPAPSAGVPSSALPARTAVAAIAPPAAAEGTSGRVAAAATTPGPATTDVTAAPAGRVGAVLAIDADDAERLARPFAGVTLLEATLARLARARRLDAIVVVTERGADARLDVPARVGDRTIRRLEVDEPPLGPRGRAIRVARAFAPWAWRGGIAGFGGLDDGLAPRALAAAIGAEDLAAVVPCGPDRPLLDPAAGVDALVDRWREHPDVHRLIFTPLPPGLGAVLLRRDLALDLGAAGRLAGAGPMLVHQPHVPQGDPLATDACVAAGPVARRSVAAIAVTEADRTRLAAAADRLPRAGGADARAVADAIERLEASTPLARPGHLVLELATGGPVPRWRRMPGAGDAPRVRADAARLAARLEAAAPLEDTVITLVGDEDPLAHPDWIRVAAAARAAGAAAVHLRTPLDVPAAAAAALVDAPVDVVSVELHAACASTWARLHAAADAAPDPDGLARVTAAIEALVAARRPLDAATGAGALALPWIVPRMQRRPETVDELETFHEHWQSRLGTAVLEPAWPGEAAICGGTARETTGGPALDASATDRPILPLEAPAPVVARELRRRLRVLADGRVPRDDRDRSGATAVADLGRVSIADAWTALQSARRTAAAAGDGMLEP